MGVRQEYAHCRSRFFTLPAMEAEQTLLLFDQGFRCPQPNSGANVGLGREERNKDLLLYLSGHAAAIVGNRDANTLHTLFFPTT